MIPKNLELLTLIFFAIGCSHQSTYTRTHATPGEIVWAYDGALVATSDGAVLNDRRWKGLADALSCVPEAATLAQKATERGPKAQAQAQAIDAVNLYNQKFMTQPGCPGFVEHAPSSPAPVPSQ
jgi:hypothetical protein